MTNGGGVDFVGVPKRDRAYHDDATVERVDHDRGETGDLRIVGVLACLASAGVMAALIWWGGETVARILSSFGWSF